MEEREQWEKEKSDFTVQKNEKDYQRAMAAVDNAIMDLLPSKCTSPGFLILSLIPHSRWLQE